MNDIEILEDMIKKFKALPKDISGKEDLWTMCKYKHYKAIENLIKRNKNLEQIEKEHKEKNGRLRDRIKELEIEKENEFKRGFFTKVAENKTNTLKIESQVIPKSLVREKIEHLKEISDNGANAVRFAAAHDDEIERIQKQRDISTMIDILQDLLNNKTN